MAGLALAFSSLGGVAWAGCATSGTVVTCTTNPPNPATTLIGSGPNTANGTTVTLNPGAQVSVGNTNAISLGDGARITLGDNSSVTNNATSGTGLWSSGNNTIEFGSNGQLTIGVGASVTANGTQNNGEPVNVMGVGNVITNRGLISSRNGAAIWFEDRVANGANTVDNYGTIRTLLGASANVIGNQKDGDVTFINRTGARVEGGLSFAGGDDQLTLEAGSVITGGFNGGGGTNSLTLGGSAGSSDSLAGDIRNFQTLVKSGQGVWTLTGAVGANGGGSPLQVRVQEGTLALTGNNASFNGGVTVDPAGVLEARAQSLPPVVSDNGLVRFAQDAAGTFSGRIQGTGRVEKTLGGDLTLSGANTYAGGTTINGGRVLITSDGNLGAASGGLILNGGVLGVTANVATARATTLGPNGGGLSAAAGTTLTHNGVVSGSGSLTKSGAGTVILSNANTYAGGTNIAGGVLQVAADSALGVTSGPLAFDGGTLRVTADMTTNRATRVTTNGGTLETTAGTTLTHDGIVSGAGTLTKSGAGVLTLTGANTQTGGTSVTGGVLRVASDANLGAAGGLLTLDGGALRTDTTFTIARNAVLGPAGGTLDTEAGTLTYAGVISGSGGLIATGAGGNAILTGNNTYTGTTTVSAGYLIINGDQSAATGRTTAEAGGRLAGSGVVGGDVVIQNGGILAPGYAPFTPATLTINGGLTLNAGSDVFYNLRDTTVGGALNDLTIVHGALTLDGAIDVLDEGQDLGPGVYRIFNYDGALTDNGLEIGAYASAPGAPTRPLTNFSVQTAVAGQINLINTTGLQLNYWDGTAGPKNDGVVNGGDGFWRHAGAHATSNFTGPDGAVNAAWADGQFAIFSGVAGAVTVDHVDGEIRASGMQFATNGYRVGGDGIELVGGEAVIRVGDGTTAGAGMTATVDSVLSGGAALTKTDLGVLVLTGANTYAGGTAVNGGVLQISSDANLGQAGTGLTLNGGALRTTADMATARATTLESDGGTFETAAGTTFEVGGAISGDGALAKTGGGVLVLTADNSFAGGTTIGAGTLQLGDGGTSGSISGAIVDNAALVVDRSNQITLGGVVSGSGSFEQAGTGTTVLTADNTYAGGTTISAGTLQLGDGGTSGSVAGDIENNGVLALDRSDERTLDGVISGSGVVIHQGSGTTILTGSNSYKGETRIDSGFLYVDGDQSAATGLTSVAGGARLGGNGVVGGNVTVADDGTLAPGVLPGTPATLTINGNLALSEDSTLLYNLQQANVAGGPVNDLTIVRGNLTLDGVINVLDEGQLLNPGVYRLINYAGGLTNNGLRIGMMTPDGVTPGDPIAGFAVQTAIAGQVNLVSTSNLTLTYWDGGAGPKDDGGIQGGDGVWRRSDSPNAQSNFTGQDGVVNAPWSIGGFAIFSGAPGQVTVETEGGAILVSGMQFASDGYLIKGDALTLAGGRPNIRVGDGTSQGATMTATIEAVLTGGTGITKSDLGVLALTGANTFRGGVVINGGVLQIASDANLGDVAGGLVFNGGALRTTADLTMDRAVTINPDGGAFETLADTALTVTSGITGGGALAKSGAGALILAGENIYTGGTIIGAGTLQIGNGGTTGSLVGDIANDGVLVVDRAGEVTLSGQISGSGALVQAGTGATILTNDNTYAGGTTIAQGTLQIGDGGTTGHVVGDILNNGVLVVNRSDTKLTPGVISGTGQLIQAGAGTLVLQADNTYTGGTTIRQGTLQVGDGGEAGAIVGDVIDDGALVFDRSNRVDFAGKVSGSGSLTQAGPDLLVLTGDSTYTGGTTIGVGTLQIGDGGTTGSIVGDVLDNGVIVLNRSDDVVYAGVVSGAGSAVKQGAGRLILIGDNTYTGGTTISAGTLQIGDGGTTGSVLGDIVDNAALVFDRSDSLLINGVISGSGSLEQAGTGTTVLNANNTYTGGTLISSGTLQIGNGGETGMVLGDIVDNGRLVVNRSNTKVLEGVISGSGELVQAGLGTLILTNTNTYAGGTAIEAGVLQISNDANLGAASGGLRLSSATLHTTADITTARETVLAQGVGVVDTDAGTTLSHSGVIEGAGGLSKIGGGVLRLSGANTYAGPTTVLAGTLLVSGDQSAATGPTTVAAGATLGGVGTVGGDVLIEDDGVLAPGEAVGTLTIGGNLALSGGARLEYELGQANVVGGPLNDHTLVGGDLVLDGTLNVTASAGGAFDPGIYRILSYGGTLTNNGLALGAVPSPGYQVQTSVAQQVNLILPPPGGGEGGGGGGGSVTLNYWDGAAGPKSDGVVNGGDGVWQNSAGNDNWTLADGTLNAPFADADFAIFVGAPGRVTVDGSLGDVVVSGMQFATNGYLVQGQTLNLAGDAATVRVGDGTSLGAAYVATLDSVVAGPSTLVKADLGTLVLNGDNTYAGGTRVNGGVLQIARDANLGAVSTGLGLDGATLRTTQTFGTARAVALGVGGGAVETVDGTTFTLNGAVGGTGALAKAGAGTLILAADNTYAGGTTVRAGVLQIARDANLGDAAGGLTIAGGALRTTASLSSARDIDVPGVGAIVTDDGTTFTHDGTITGAGDLAKAGGGTLVLSGDGSAYAGIARVVAGTLAVDGALGGALQVQPAGRLVGTGRVGEVTNQGVVAPGRDGFGVLIAAGYAGAGGALEIETELGGDASPTDRLVVTGATAGATQVSVINRGGLGGPTVEGVKIVDVGGASNGVFTLHGNYLFEGQPALIAGAFGYRLYKNGVANPTDGDWYLRSSLLSPLSPTEPPTGPPAPPPTGPEPPLYQPGVPVYETYPATLMALNEVPTLQQRVGNRSWAGKPLSDESAGVWGRISGAHSHLEPVRSTGLATRNLDQWQVQMGVDAPLMRGDGGGVLIGGLAAHYATADADIRSVYGGGDVKSKGYGLSATLTWYGPGGDYVDAQARLSRYDSDLTSQTLGKLGEGLDGTGQAFSLEAGKRMALTDALTLTPQFQVAYSSIDFDPFTDRTSAMVSDRRGDSLRTRLGLSVDRQDVRSDARRRHVYALANLTYEWRGGPRVDVSGTPIALRDERLWGELSLGGSYGWDRDRITLYSEVSAATSMANFGDSYSLRGVVGLRWGF